jgi:hypothetical protein
LPKCGTRTYKEVSKTRIDTILSEAVSQGAIIKGSNPWNIDTRMHGAVLHISWHETERTMAVTVENVVWYIPCETVWSTIDTLMNGFNAQQKEMKGKFEFEKDAG